MSVVSGCYPNKLLNVGRERWEPVMCSKVGQKLWVTWDPLFQSVCEVGCQSVGLSTQPVASGRTLIA